MHPMSFNRIGTPRNGPSGRSPAASARASSKRVRMTASSAGLTDSMRVIAASTSSAGLDLAPSDQFGLRGGIQPRRVDHRRMLVALPDTLTL